jgi:hypothetical protein
MDEKLLNKINKNLYDVQAIIEPMKEEFEKYDIDADNFLSSINLYLSNFYQLKESTEENLIVLLDFLHN